MEMIKYWRGKHIILKKEDVINEYIEGFVGSYKYFYCFDRI